MPTARRRKRKTNGGKISAAEALEYAVQLHRSGKADLAEVIYKRILAAVPDDPDALHFYAILKHQSGRSREAVPMLEKAIAQSGGDAGMHNNLGNILIEGGDAARAATAYAAAIAIDADHVEAHGNLGVALRRLGRLDEAEQSYRNALALNPTYREGYDNLGRLLASRGRIKEAITCLARAMELAPHNAEGRRILAATYAACGEYEKALAIIDEWIAQEPESPSALHLRASISGENVPARASDRYVQSTFDSFAASFESKLARLDYQAPQLVAEVLERACGPPAADRILLDAGCGTGLCGPLLQPFASRLVGVDLSPGMLQRARERSIYQELAEAELTRYLAAHVDAFDIIVSADTLCYFGDLAEVIGAARTALREGGILVFTAERADESAPFQINPHGRYSHRRDYVAGILEAAGFIDIVQEDGTLRMERGEPVAGLVVTARVLRRPRFDV